MSNAQSSESQLVTPARKRGLVLEGGGAKGAYALGCLLAFRDLGINFHAVSGTSVGALNAALLATDQIDEGRAFWSSLSFRSVCEPNWRNIPMWLLLPIHSAAMLLHGIRAFGFTPKLPPREGIAATAIFIGAPALGSMAFLVIASFFSEDQSALAGLSILLLYIPIAIVCALPFVFRAAGWTVFNTSPLRRTLHAMFANSDAHIPIYVTIASRKLTFDPDFPGFYYTSAQAAYTCDAMSEELYVPRYLRLDLLTGQTRTDVLQASAAIPFGIFPNVSIDGCNYVDGGMIDNCPVFPLVSIEGCDAIIVVRLRPVERGFLRKSWQDADRTLRVAEIDSEESRRMYRAWMDKHGRSSGRDKTINPPANVPYREPESWPREVLVIAPAKSLGGFLRGTMNFRARYAKKLIALGYRDAIRALESASNADSRPGEY